MRHSGIVLLLLAFLTITSGCGTLANLEGEGFWIMTEPSRPPLPFGGVAGDMVVMARGTLAPANRAEGAVIASLALLDLPFSIVGDAVTLPWTTFEFTREQLAPSGRYDFFKDQLDASPFTPGLQPDSAMSQAPTLQFTPRDPGQ